MADPQVFHFDGRIETGAACNGDDWPGIFIRGDEAMGLAARLEYCLHTGTEQIRGNEQIRQIVLRDLIELLKSCAVHG